MNLIFWTGMAIGVAGILTDLDLGKRKPRKPDQNKADPPAGGPVPFDYESWYRVNVLGMQMAAYGSDRSAYDRDAEYLNYQLQLKAHGVYGGVGAIFVQDGASIHHHDFTSTYSAAGGALPGEACSGNKLLP